MNALAKSLGCLLVPALLAGAPAAAQDKAANYPTRPIRILISVAPGAGADMVARMTAQIMHERWGQNVVVDPRPGGGGVIASTTAAKADPDGHTLYQNGFGLLMQGATKRVDFDILKTFEPVVRTTAQPYILVVHASVPAKTLKDLIAQSAVKTLTYAGSSGVGSTVHVGMERLSKVTGMKAKHVAYKGSAPALLALMGGEIDMAATSAMSATAAIKTGKVRGVATLGRKRISALPDLPTLAEQGVTNVVIDNQYNLWAPAKTPRAIINAINKAVSEGMNKPENEKRLAASGSEAVDPMPSEELKKHIAQEYADLQQTVRELGLKF